MDSDGGFNCPSGLSPCSTNSTLGGSTLCLKDTDDCPITDLEILDLDSDSYKITDSRYTAVKSGLLDYNKYVVFTTTTNERSNSPLQKLTLEYGTPCAYTNQKNVLDSGMIVRDFYALEVEGLRSSCKKLPKTSKSENPTTAIDTRYTTVSPSLSTYPDEYSIQFESGVYAELSNMPYFNEYCPQAQAYKSQLFYDFYGRETLPYDKSGCH